VTDVLVAQHSSFFGRSEDYWIVSFGLDWGTRVIPEMIDVLVDAETGKATFKPIL
jgi:hypothetical protein